jgi:hypothetical protein
MQRTSKRCLITYSHSLTITRILLIAVCLLGSGCATTATAPSHTYHPELEYLKALHQAGPVQEPQLTTILMQQFMNSNQFQDGIEFFESLQQKHESRLNLEQKALYLSAIGVLRASIANQVPLLNRIAWVNETIDRLEQARVLTHNDNFLVRWMAAVVYAQLPDRFGTTDTAFTDLQWCVDNIDKAPPFRLAAGGFLLAGRAVQKNRRSATVPELPAGERL